MACIGRRRRASKPDYTDTFKSQPGPAHGMHREYFCTECRDDPDRSVFVSEDRDLVYEHITAEHEGVRPLLAMTTRVEREDA